ncbi:SDR family oxidoreductase [Flammeovirga pectinis]|uniref:SDR family oxidoreductase n=1 Tax=Flammeovirga pectinis TaxID=2494373 RepID=A0A3S9P048_9BACT|nr:NAD-dependent epimerase/dehydratase family protein [Flammeovirga pectinis]AZQ61552.1 SDR family oxidoreductase [Flammeovirga pectinis]
MSNTAIITGGSGFVGSNLARFLLQKGWNIHLILRKSSNTTNIEDIIDKISIFYHDNNISALIEYFQTTNSDVVYHLASYIKTEHEPSDIIKLINSNVLFSTEILEACSKASIKYFINTGTYWQYYQSDEYNPVDLYASTKEAFEKIIKYYVEAEGLKVMTLKLYDTYGENDTRPKLINLLHKFADEGKVLDMSAGEQKLYLTHISDICEAYHQAYLNIQSIESHLTSYAIRSEKSYSLKEIIQTFEILTNKKVNINWGSRLYRKREVMKPNNTITILKNWNPKISLKNGLKRY